MKRVFLTVATLTLACAAVALAGNPNGIQVSVSQPQIVALQDHSQAQPEAKTFIGTIHKSGDLFVLREDTSKASYQLDDQQSASKFDGRKVKVTGVLDASNNTIRVQSIEEANA